MLSGTLPFRIGWWKPNLASKFLILFTSPEITTFTTKITTKVILTVLLYLENHEYQQNMTYEKLYENTLNFFTGDHARTGAN